MISARALSNSAAHDSLKSVAQKSVSAVLLVLIGGEEFKKKKKEISLLKVAAIGLADTGPSKDPP